MSPDFLQRVQEHQISPRFFDPRRPGARRSVRSRENVVKLRRRAPAPGLDRIFEVQEEPTPPQRISPIRRSVRDRLRPRQALAFDESVREDTEEAAPEKVTTTETMTYQDPCTGVPVTETVIEESVYAPHQSPARSSPVRSPQRSPRRSPRTPCASGIPCLPPQLSPVDFDIDEAFAGSMSPDFLDTSDIPEDVETEPFAWLD